MAQVKTVHLGGIDRHRESVCTIVKGNRAGLFKELNNWLFDYFYAQGSPIQQLPPLDDWSKSTEDPTYYYVSSFPDSEWHIWIKTEICEF